MKNGLILAIALSILLHSCYSYKSIDLRKTTLVVGKKYKIKVNKKFVKVKLISFNDSIANFQSGNTEKQIKLSEIQKLKKRKFSASKTVLLPVSILIGSFTIIIIDGFKINVYSDNSPTSFP